MSNVNVYALNDLPTLHETGVDFVHDAVTGLWKGTTDDVTAAAITGYGERFYTTAEINRFAAMTKGFDTAVAALQTAHEAVDAAAAAVADDVDANLAPAAAYAADFATGTLTSDETAPADGATVTVGGKVYTFKTALTPTEGQVLIGSDVDASAALTNLKAAINHTGTPDTDYKCAAVNAGVTGGTLTATTLLVTAKTAGAAGETASTETSTHLAWGAATLLRDAGLKSAADATAATLATDTGTLEAAVATLLPLLNAKPLNLLAKYNGKHNPLNSLTAVYVESGATA